MSDDDEKTDPATPKSKTRMRRPMTEEDRAELRQKADLLDDLARRMREPVPDFETVEAGAEQLVQYARELRNQSRVR